MPNSEQLQVIQGIECYEKDGTAYLKLETVARGLGFTDVKNGVEYVRWNTVKHHLKGLKFSQEVAKDSFIPENIFYRLAMKAKNEAAEAFQEKVADEVIPSIRKHGAYMTPETIEKTLTNPDFIIQLATQLKEEQAKRIELEAKVEADAPKVLFSDSVEASDCSILVGQLAKQLRQNGVDVGQQRLFKKLRSEGYLCSSKGDRYNMPSQRSMEMGLFEIKERTVNNPVGSIRITCTPLVTGKGQIYFTNRYLKEYETQPRKTLLQRITGR